MLVTFEQLVPAVRKQAWLSWQATHVTRTTRMCAFSRPCVGGFKILQKKKENWVRTVAPLLIFSLSMLEAQYRNQIALSAGV